MDRLASSGSDTRVGLWLEALECIGRNPMGGGFRHLSSAPWAHNIFLDFTLWNGAAGLLAMLCVYGVALKNLFLIFSRKTQLERPLVVALSICFLASFFVGMISPPFPSYVIFCFMFIGFSTAALGMSGSVRGQEPASTPLADAKDSWGFGAPPQSA
jgi:hypothetical protein